MTQAGDIVELPASRSAERSIPLLRRRLPVQALLAFKAMALGFVALELIVYFRWLPRWLDLRLDQAATTKSLLSGWLPYEATIWGAAAIGMVALSIWCITAFLVLWRRSQDLFGLLLFVCFVSAGVIGSTDVFEILRMQRTDSWSPFPAIVMYTANAFCMLWVYVFPDGRFVPKWASLFACAWVVWNMVRLTLSAADMAAIGIYAVVINLLLVGSAVASLFWRYRFHASPVRRNQLKWLLLGCMIAFIVYAIVSIIIAMPALQKPGSGFLLRVGSTALMSLALVAVPTAMLVAIFRQGLLDIDYLINRTLVYGSLTVVTIAAFFLISSVVRELMHRTIGQVSELLTIMLALPMAMAFLPVRSKVGRVFDRFLSERTVLTVMFIDIVESTELAVRVGDREWLDILRRFRESVRGLLASYGGEEVDTAGDGLFATFIGPGGAIQCARSVIDEVESMGIRLRIGLHTGEVDRYGTGVTGVAVHVGARVMALASADEIFVSAALRDLVAGSRTKFQYRGDHALKGLPGVHGIYSLA